MSRMVIMVLGVPGAGAGQTAALRRSPAVRLLDLPESRAENALERNRRPPDDANHRGRRPGGGRTNVAVPITEMRQASATRPGRILAASALGLEHADVSRRRLQAHA
jgi:hypothetical protein